jgi:hypothetical protein
MRRELFLPSAESEARLLLLINAFSGGTGSLEGRTKLAKLDFLLRYPAFFRRALVLRAPEASIPGEELSEDDIETRMIRYRYGPWDPAYFALLGRLIGRGLVIPIPLRGGVGYKVTEPGHILAEGIATDDAWRMIAERTRLLKRHFNLSGARLKDFIYANFPEVTGSSWGEQL